MATREKNIWILLLFILSGIVVGGLLGNLAGHVDFLSWLAYGEEFGLSTPIELDLNVVKLTFGLMFKINIASIIGVLLAIIFYSNCLIVQKLPIKMKQLPISERPYEKLEMYGENTLSNAELLAIIIKSGTKEESSVTLAQKILSLGKQNNFNQDSFTFLQELSINELMQIKRNRQSKSNSNKSCM